MRNGGVNKPQHKKRQLHGAGYETAEPPRNEREKNWSGGRKNGNKMQSWTRILPVLSGWAEGAASLWDTRHKWWRSPRPHSTLHPAFVYVCACVDDKWREEAATVRGNCYFFSGKHFAFIFEIAVWHNTIDWQQRPELKEKLALPLSIYFMGYLQNNNAASGQQKEVHQRTQVWTGVHGIHTCISSTRKRNKMAMQKQKIPTTRRIKLNA